MSIYAVKEKLPSCVVMGDLNTKVGTDNTLLEHAMEKLGLGDRNDNGGRLVDFCSFHCVIIGGEVSWISTDRRHTSNQIDYFAISSRFSRNQRGDDGRLSSIACCVRHFSQG